MKVLKQLAVAVALACGAAAAQAQYSDNAIKIGEYLEVLEQATNLSFPTPPPLALEKVVEELRRQSFKSATYKVRAAELEVQAAEQNGRSWLSSCGARKSSLPA